MLQKKHLLVILFFAIFLAGSLFLDSCETDKAVDSNENPPETNNYIGDQECKSCHSNEYESWKTSDHFMAMLPAEDSTVFGDFDDVIFQADSITSRFYTKNTKYYVNTRGASGKNEDFEVKYIFGHYPLQQYMVESDKGRIQVLRQSWDMIEKKWFHQYPGQFISEHDWLDWTNGAQTWNTMCADCHSTDLQKNYIYKDDSFHTEWSSINVSCESCHGPGERHAYHYTSSNSSDYDESHYMFHNSDTTNIAQVEMCAPCHSRRVNLGGDYALTGNLFDNFIPEILRTEYYHPDGQVEDENYVYGSFVQSKMFHNYVKCTSCHDPHSMKLKLEGNMLCQQCHDVSYNDPSHHFHEMNTASSECISCHMPAKVYMGNDLRHDHSFRIPRPDQSVKYGTPNTCNDCHSEKSNKWAADAIDRWYGKERSYHFSDDLIEGSLMNENSYQYLIALLQKDSIPDIAKATAIHYLSLIDPVNALPYFLSNLKNNSPLLRVHSLKALNGIPFSYWLTYAEPLLSDSIRAVRISAYELFINVPEERLGKSLLSDIKRSKFEYETYLDHQLDFPLGKAGKGLYKQKLGFYDESKKYYEAAINQDSLQTGIRTNLSLVYNALGENEKAKEVLLNEIALNPNDINALYNLALLYYELGETASSKKYFESCVNNDPQNARIYYNYGLLLQQEGAMLRALEVFNKGLAISPLDNDLNYIIAIYHLNNNNAKEAKKYLETLVKNNPNNQQYLQMLRSISQVN